MHTILKKIRKEKGLTQKEVANMLGVSRSCVANWELGIREPDLSIIKLYNDNFGYKTDFCKVFEKSKNEKMYTLDISMLNSDGLTKMMNYYTEIINNPKYLKNS